MSNKTNPDENAIVPYAKQDLIIRSSGLAKRGLESLLAKTVIGIDLGTTMSIVAVMEGGKPTIITNAEGSRHTPSIVAMSKSGERLIGQKAKRQSITNPENTIYSIKRFMGRKWGEPVGRELPLEEEARRKSYKVTKGPNNETLVLMGDKKYNPEEISAMILQKLKQDAEAYLGEKVSEAVITVPAYFNDRQRQTTRDAGGIAGLKVLRIMNEPTAAALAYRLDKKKDQVVAVYDLGSYTFDISILEVGEGFFQVKSTRGDTHFGGDDFDQRIMDWLCYEFKKSQGIDIRQDKMALQLLKEAAEKAKCELSTEMQTEISLPFITADASSRRHLDMTLTRAKLEQLVMDLVERTADLCKQALSDAGLTSKHIHQIILVGGQTRMPLVQQKVKEIFGKEPNNSVNPDEVVAMGAAIQGGMLKGEVSDVLLLDVTPLTLGIKTSGGISTPIIRSNSTIPVSKSFLVSTVNDAQPSIEIHLVQGERLLARDNHSLGRVIIQDIPPAPRGVPRIEVTLDIDTNGIMSMKAHDKGTGKEQRIVITASSGLSRNEIQKMKHEAALYANENIQDMTYNTSESLNEKSPYGFKLLRNNAID